MKRITVLLMAVVAFTLTSEAQLREVPADAEKYIAEKYDHPETVEWTDNLTNFTAVFTQNNQLHKCRFSNKGKWQQTEITIEKDAVPADVMVGLDKSRYADWEVQQWADFTSAKHEGSYYRATVAQSKLEKKYLYFNPEGRLVKEAIAL